MSDEKNTYFIGDIAKRLEISQRTIRYYEELGLITPTRSSGGFRIYADSEVERLKAILLLKELGMSLDEILSLIKLWHAGVPSEVSPQMRETLRGRLKDFRSMIAKYQRGIDQLEQVLDLIKICASCGHTVDESTCSHCLSKRQEKIPPLMKTLL